MASIDVGTHDKREVNRDLPLIPFIDFLLCLISFLLITAVWSQLARVEATARVPGQTDIAPPAEQPKRLHVHVTDHRFDLQWRQGSTLIATASVKREPVPAGNGDTSFPELAKRVTAEWHTNGLHRDASDQKQDLAVLHASNTTSYADLVAVMDAIKAPHRELDLAGTRRHVSAFSVSFAVD